MNCIDWAGAKTFCEWIGGRLPTEDEWQYAATHDGTQALQTTYPWGNDAPTHCGHAIYAGGSTNYYCDGRTEAASSVGTSAVGTYSPLLGDSPLGLQDMTGNVWEFTSSLYDLSCDPANEKCAYVGKGGSWSENSIYLPVAHRSTFHDYFYPTGWFIDLGFRCAE